MEFKMTCITRDTNNDKFVVNERTRGVFCRFLLEIFFFLYEKITDIAYDTIVSVIAALSYQLKIVHNQS